MPFPENVFKAVQTAPHCEDRVDDEVYREWGGDDDRYGYGVEFRQLASEDGDDGGEEERVDGEEL